jgi:hypothetical protein
MGAWSFLGLTGVRDPSLVAPMPNHAFQAKVNGPATHALVIGAGHYRHLPGGASTKKFKNHDGMGQLKSPPASARAFARWLIEEYKAPDRPLSTVTLLTSEKTPEKLEYQRSGAPKVSVKPPSATMPAVAQAIKEWKALGDQNPRRLMIFYFCGHGMTAGPEVSLLMEDFGEDPQAPLEGALDFRRFQANMETCTARHQCFFVDACRVGSDFLEKQQGFAGHPVLNWDPNFVNPDGQTRLGPIFYASLAKTPAYARAGKVSVFTEALLEALRGAGSGDQTGPWEVRPSRMYTALHQIMEEMSQILQMPIEQIPSSDKWSDFPINTLDQPLVPVFIKVQPKEAHAVASLRCEPLKKKRPPKPETWKLSVVPGQYSFFAEFKKNAFKPASMPNESVSPPFWSKPLKALL